MRINHFTNRYDDFLKRSQDGQPFQHREINMTGMIQILLVKIL